MRFQNTLTKIVIYISLKKLNLQHTTGRGERSNAFQNKLQKFKTTLKKCQKI